LFGFRFFRSLCTPFSVILMSLMVLNFPVIEDQMEEKYHLFKQMELCTLSNQKKLIY
jgi:hypothetical protein